ncbi:uncharacterized protein LOC143298530 isoform X2 [Babylonia areolata]|uniref:uncharacterized protein LOC143278988 n=1 Tax=Babylonia areolata TaxID=304850 RepID=UPI003FD196AF
MVTTALVVVVATCAALASAGSDCYNYYDHAAQYRLDHEAPSYPWAEVEQAMKQNPQLSEVMAKGTLVPTSRPPDQHYYKPVSEVCPSARFMLKAFTVDSKQCYVIKPQVQQLRYTRCSAKYNRDCHYCTHNQGGVSKCEEDYEWQTVWAYCKPIIPTPYPHPHPDLYPKPHVVYPKPTLVYPQTYPTYPKPHPHPQPRPYPGKVLYPAKLYAKTYYDPYAYKRWKRSPHIGGGKVEKISLYLPYQCGCKSFRC